MQASTWSQDGYAQAYQFAAQAHNGQTVPGTNLPYLMHVSLVSMEVMAALCATSGGNGDLAVQCALLHDVIEDTAITYDEVATRFGRAVAEGVQALSKNPELPNEAQMADSLRRIRLQPVEVWMVKLADRITNLQKPPEYWKRGKIMRYLEEARLILTELGEANAFLAGRLEEKIRDYESYAGS